MKSFTMLPKGEPDAAQFVDFLRLKLTSFCRTMSTPNHNKPSRSIATLVCSIGVALGLAAIVAGIAWRAFGSGELMYSKEQAHEYSAAKTALHAATSGHGDAETGSTPSNAHEPVDAAIAEARQRLERAEQDIATARFAHEQLAAWLIRIGLATVMVFGIGYLATRRD